tara:strand:+ start:286 stop:2484 length:2199 start_codon:yes stop_codon:yes gene_type:complete
MYADVYLPISIDKSFSYLVPNDLKTIIKVGQFVSVPFGKYSQIAYVHRINSNSSYKGKLKAIHKIVSDGLSNNCDLLETIDWISKYYVTPKNIVIKNIFPHFFNNNFYLRSTYKKIAITSLGKKSFTNKSIKGINRLNIINHLYCKNKFVDVKTLSTISKSYNNSIKTLLRDKYISLKEVNKKNNPLEDVKFYQKASTIKLSDKQNEIYKNLKSKDNFSVNLIHGVTGSGKTEIYIKLTQDIIDKNKSALILVPEIVLTPQTAKRFKKYFGDKVGVWNSSLSLSEKKWTWDNINNQNIKVIIGTRSSIFLPIKNLSLIITDEEHDYSYKQSEKMPTYNARDIAIIRSKILNTKVVLGSATPSLESYYNSITKKYNLFDLQERYGKSVYPTIDLINMFDNQNGINTLFSSNLIQAIKNCLIKKEQIILLHNRRGYATILFCSKCDYIFKSNKTSAPLTYHRTLHQLVCHHTEEKYNVPQYCPNCNSSKLQFKGYGTERVLDEIKQIFNEANVARLDSDSTRLKDSHKKILKKFELGEIDILIGTQMVSKGFDFHNVTLVGVINADLGLFLPDFRSGEKIFQLLYQVCGRTGRGDKKGQAIIQTFNSEDPFISCATMMDTKKYYNISLAERMELSYPPFSKLVRIFLKGKNLNQINNLMSQIAKLLEENKFRILGPTAAPIEKINDYYRSHIIIKTDKPLLFQDFYIKNLELNEKLSNIKGIKFRIDVDPLSLL